MLKKYAFAAAAAAALCSAGPALASGNTTVAVSATVNQVCHFINEGSSSGTITIAAIDPSTVGSSGASNTLDVTYHCTTGTTPAVTVSSGGTTLTDSSTGKTIAYSLSLGTADAGAGFGSGAGTTKVTATATIAQAAAQAAAGGTYSDTVTLAIDH